MEKQVIDTLIELVNDKIEELRADVYELQHYSGNELGINKIITKIASYKITIDQLQKMKDFKFPTSLEINAVIKNLEVSDGYAIAFMDGCLWHKEQIKSKLLW